MSANRYGGELQRSFLRGLRWKIVIGNSFLIKASLEVTDFVADKLYCLAFIDYGTIRRLRLPLKSGGLV